MRNARNCVTLVVLFILSPGIPHFKTPIPDLVTVSQCKAIPRGYLHSQANEMCGAERVKNTSLLLQIHKRLKYEIKGEGLSAT